MRPALPIVLAGAPLARLAQAGAPSLFKSASAMTVTFNDVFTYTLVFTIPAGATITSTALVDSLPDNNPNTEANFSYVNNSSIGPTPGPGTPDIPDFQPAVFAGRIMTWTLGAITNTSGIPYVYTITYRVNVNGGENRVEVGTNAATLAYFGGSVGASTDVTVARGYPNPHALAVSTGDTSAGDSVVASLRAGDVLTFTLRVTNALDASTAYDLIVSDTLPVWLVYGGPAGTTPPPDAVISTAAGTQVGWRAASLGGSLPQLNALAPGASITPLVFTATVASTVAAGRQDNNQMRVAWRDLPGDEPPQTIDYNNVQLRSATVSVAKSEVDAFTPQGRVLINEPITYTLVVTIPAGTTVYTPAHVFDTLNDGLNYGGEVSHSGLTLGAVAGPSGSNTLITWTLTSSVAASSDVTMTFVFTAYSDGTLVGRQINKGEGLNNSASMQWHTGSSLVNSPPANVVVTFVRPDIQPNKEAYRGGAPTNVIAAGGETIQYRITNVGNGSGVGDTTAAPAYDVLITDTLPAGFGFVESVPPPDGVFTLGSSTVLTWGVVPTLPVGYYLPGVTTTAQSTFYVTATAPITLAAGPNYTNTVVVQYSDQPGDASGEQTYAFTRTKVLVVNFVETKSVTPSAPLRIGDVVTYTLVDSTPAGATMHWPRHQDDLPQGVRFVSGSMTLQGMALVSSSIPITIPLGAQERLLWWTETLSNAYGGAPLVVTTTFNARVTGFNLTGQALFSSTGEFRGASGFGNSARLDWNTADISGTLNASLNSNGVGSQVVQPFLADSPFAKRFAGSTSGSTTIGAGEVVTYQIVVTNTGRGAAYDVVLSDTLPAGLQLETFGATGRTAAGVVFTPTFLAAPTAGATGSLGWIVDAIPAGDGDVVAPSTNFTLTYTALVSSAVGAGAALPNQATLSDYSSLPGDDPFERHYAFLLGATRAITLNTPAAAIAKSVSATGATWLDVITYTLAFPQPPVNATLYNVAVTDSLPPQISVLGVEAAGGVGTAAGFSGSVVTATAGSVAPLSQMVVTITARIDSGASGAKVNTATLEWDDAATGGARHAATTNPVTTTILLPDLIVAKSGPPVVGLGASVLYTVVVTNAGTADAQSVSLSDDLPDDLAFAAFSASATVTQTAGPDPLGFDLGRLPPGQARTLWITATSPLTLTPGSLLTNTVAVSSTSPGENTANNTAQFVSSVSGVRLEVRKTANVASVAPAGTIVYAIEYSNTGTAAATGVVVSDTYDPNVTFLAANPAPNVGNNVWNAPSTLAAGERRTIVVTVTVAPALPNGTPITNRAQVSASSAATQQATSVVTVTSAAVLTIDKNGHGATMPGNTLIYRLAYANVGNAPATSARLTETYPSELTFVAASPAPAIGDNVWDLGTLTPPVSGAIVITLTVGSGVPNGAVFTNTVTLDSAETEAVTDTFKTRVGPIYLPLVMRNFTPTPNLIVQSVVVSPAAPLAGQATIISVTIANSGTAPAEAGFWIDLYVDPASAPQPGQPWNEIAPFGKAWILRTPLPAGQSITLDTTMPDDPANPGAIYSNWPGWFTTPGAHTLYAQVDSYGGAGGLVVELSELDNLFGPLDVTVSGSGTVTPTLAPTPVLPRFSEALPTSPGFARR
jgi:uncharacterized repeat protein (TIGR01451 family)/fimbrial isopeptide formation D2 family protein